MGQQTRYILSNCLWMKLGMMIACTVAGTLLGMEEVEQEEEAISVQDLIAREEVQGREGIIYLSHNKLASLSGLEKIKTAPEIDRLYIFASRIRNLPPSIFDRFSNLTVFWLDGVPINELHESQFEKLILLKQVCIAHTNITTLHPRIFSTLRNLKILHLFSNKLDDLPDGLIDTMTKLASIDLDRNNIRSIPHHFFAHQKRLKCAHFTNNKLSCLPNLTHLIHLKSLLIKGNKGIRDLPQPIIDWILAHRIGFDKPKLLRGIPDHSFWEAFDQHIGAHNMPRGEISLENQGITNFKSTTMILFDPAECTPHILSCRNNYLKNFSSLFFRVVGHVIQISFPLFTNLRELILAHNHLEKVPSIDLGFDLPRLESLDLSHNKITRMGQLQGKNRLRCLYLNNNKIASLAEGTFDDLTELIYLDLADNKLEVIPRSIFKKLLKLKRLFLELNSLGCMEPLLLPEQNDGYPLKVTLLPQKPTTLKMLAKKKIAKLIEQSNTLETVKLIRPLPSDLRLLLEVGSCRRIIRKIRIAQTVLTYMAGYNLAQNNPKLTTMWIDTMAQGSKGMLDALFALAPDELRNRLIQKGLGSIHPKPYSSEPDPTTADLTEDEDLNLEDFW